MPSITKSSISLTLIFFILFVGALGNFLIPEPFTISQDQLIVRKFEKQWILQFQCQAHIGPCSINYISVPRGWMINREKLIVPVENTVTPVSYTLNVNISVPTGYYALAKMAVYFENERALLTIQSIQKSWQITPQSNVQKNNQTTVVQNKNQNEQNFLVSNGIIDSLPSLTLLQTHLNKSLQINLTIALQKILQYPNCTQKVPYLPQLITILQQYRSESTKKQENSISTQINLGSYIDELLANKSKILGELSIYNNIGEVQVEIRMLQNLQRVKQSDMYRYQSITNAYKSRLISILNTLGIGPQELKLLQNTIKQDQQQLLTLEQQINTLNTKKKQIQKNLQANNKKLKDIELSSRYSGDSQAANSLQKKVIEYSQLRAKAAQQFREISGKLERLVGRIQNYEEDKKRLNGMLEEIQREIGEAQKFMNQSNNTKIQKILQIVNKNMPTLKQQLKQCQQQLQQQKQQQLQLQQSQQQPQSKPIPQINITQLRKTKLFNQPINIFTSQWIINYGVPQPFRFICSQRTDAKAGYGRILDINKSVIKVEDAATKGLITLHIALCTKVTGPTWLYLPKIGDIVDWQGIQQNKDGTNIYKAFSADIYTSNN